MSKLIESLRGDLAELYIVGAISKITMREFDAICPPPTIIFMHGSIRFTHGYAFLYAVMRGYHRA